MDFTLKQLETRVLISKYKTNLGKYFKLFKSFHIYSINSPKKFYFKRFKCNNLPENLNKNIAVQPQQVQ